MKRYYIIFYLVLIALKGYAQNERLGAPQVSFHSPESGSLGKYVDYPIELSTGTIDLNVPIFSLPYKSNKIDISLKYHTSGIKPSEASSSVGLGWSLWAGGGISRVLRGKPDESTNGFKNIGGSLPDLSDINSNTVEGRILADTSYLANSFKSNKDVEPDLYYLQAPNLNLEFTVNNQGKYICNNLDSVLITYNDAENLFKVINKNGDVYLFGKTIKGVNCSEVTSSNNSFMTTGGTASSLIPVPTQAYISSWKLTEIISADRSDTVFFNYQHFSSSSFLKTSESRSVPLQLLEGNVDRKGVDYGAITKNFSEVNIGNVSLISTISYQDNVVYFDYVNDRLDVVPMTMAIPRLQNIKVTNKGQVIKNFKFNNNFYFERQGASNSVNNMPIKSYLMKSLKLNSVTEYVSDLSLARSWRFSYDETPLPAVGNTNAIDYWGYYNGKANASLIPENFYSNANLGKPIFMGENRKSDFNFMKAGILKRIEMPQGGYTVFEYEPNYYLTRPQQENKTPQDRRISLFAANPTNGNPTCPSLPPIKNTYEFTVDEDLDADMVLGTIYVNFSDYQMVGSVYPTAKITNLSTNDYKSFSHLPVNKDKNQSYSDNIIIRKGNKYRIELNLEGNTGNSKYGICGVPSIEFGLTYKYWEISQNPDTTLKLTQAGGLRIRKVTNFDQESELNDYTIYYYGDSLQGTERIGAGKLYTDIGNYFYNEKVLWYSTPYRADLKSRIFFTSNSNSEIGFNNGCPVYYSKITTEKYGRNNIPIGRTVTYFNDKVKELSNLYPLKYPYLNIIFPSWSKTNVSKEEIYSFENNSYKKIKDIEFIYGATGYKKVKAVRMEVLGPEFSHADIGGNGVTPIYIINQERYFIHNNFYSLNHTFLQSKIEKSYFGSGASLETSSAYEYNKYYDLSKLLINNSAGKTKTILSRYSGDLSSKLGENMVSLPVQQEFWEDGKVVGGVIYVRQPNGNINRTYEYNNVNLGLPITFTNYNTIPTGYIEDKKIEFNPKNNTIRSIESKKSAPVIYLWGYGGQYPVSEIKNATYAEVVAVLTQPVIDNLNLMTHSEATMETLIKNAADKLRSGLPKSMVTSYTYKPLVGMTSKTDARGIRETYKYDGMQRLQAILDHLNNVTKSVDYHYRSN